MRPTHVDRTVGRLVQVELMPLVDLADVSAVRGAGEYAASSFKLAGPHVRLALTLAVFGLDTLTFVRFLRPFRQLSPARATAWWGTLRGYPGFAQLRQLARTPAMLYFSERIHLDRGN